MAGQTMPSQGSNGGRNIFDRFADRIAAVTARAWFFALCVAIVVGWLPSYFVVGSLDTWQLLINTTTTIITFLLVGLMQNTTARDTAALHQKLNAHAAATLLLLTTLGHEDSKEAHELREAVGLEHEESA